MVEKRERSGVASHTEYIRGRFQCVRCGMSVPVDSERAGRRVCGRCASAH